MKLVGDLRPVYVSAFLRSVGVGMVAVDLGIYLSRAGFSATRIGLVISAGLAGVAVSTLLTSMLAERVGRRRTLVLLCSLAAIGGLGLALTANFFALLLFAFAGMLNAAGHDRGAASSVEQVLVSESVSPTDRTEALARYNIVLSVGHALGALAAGLPFLLRSQFGIGLFASYRSVFGFYGLLCLLSAASYLFLSPQAGFARKAIRPGRRVSKQSKEVVTSLALLFSMDSLGGGFLTTTILAYWFFRRFGITEAGLAPIFFTAQVLNSVSYMVAARLARWIGLVNTMVFTHIPSSLLLMAVPFAPSLSWAIGLFLAREGLVQMDVPTRQSYLMAAVQPEDRVFASGITTLSRNISRTCSSSLSGYVIQNVSLAAPLFLGGATKIIYDVLLYAALRRREPGKQGRKPCQEASPSS
ncbi:MAG TPA: MFS transporter [Candidatus Dormibacteraeota bacterium]|nr:MFS transporter [Candidatus Dormibacteraeota bacterium]